MADSGDAVMSISFDEACAMYAAALGEPVDSVREAMTETIERLSSHAVTGQQVPDMGRGEMALRLESDSIALTPEECTRLERAKEYGEKVAAEVRGLTLANGGYPVRYLRHSVGIKTPSCWDSSGPDASITMRFERADGKEIHCEFGLSDDFISDAATEMRGWIAKEIGRMAEQSIGGIQYG